MRITTLILCLLLGTSLQAQTIRQSGYVRTVGRPNNHAGTRLSGALIRVAGQHNVVQSGRQGAFTLLFNHATAGQTAFTLTSVRLNGYELNEREMLGRKFAVSPTVPVEVVMVSEKEKRDIEERVRQQVEQRYQKKLRRIESEKARLGKRYQQELDRLEAEYERRDMLVNDMVSRYASTDYAHLDSLSARINAFIESGELERADSMINSMNVGQLEQEHQALKDNNEKMREALQRSEQAENSAASQLNMIYEAKFNIFATKFENDSAAIYLDKQLALDSLNVSALRHASIFYCHFFVNYPKALHYAQRALEVTCSHGGEKSTLAVHCLIELALVEEKAGKIGQALATDEKAYALAKEVIGENDPLTARICNNIGFMLAQRNDFDGARRFYEKALSVYKSLHEEDATDYFILMNNMATLDASQGNYAQALSSMQKLHDVFSRKYGETSREVSVNVNNIATLLGKMGHYEESIDYYKKALSAMRVIYNGKHPQMANVLSNMASSYMEMSLPDSALVYQQQALEMAQQFHAPESPRLIQHLGNMAEILKGLKRYDEALSYINRAMEITRASLGEEHLRMANLYNNIGALYDSQKKYAEAIAAYEKALYVRRKRLGNDHPLVAIIMNNMAYTYNQQKQYEEALKQYVEAYRIFSSRLGAHHPHAVSCHTSMACVYDELGRYAEALPIYHEAMAYELTLKRRRQPTINLIHQKLYSDYVALANEHPAQWADSLNAFMAERAFWGYIVEGSAAEVRGLKGKVVVLQYADWTYGSRVDLINEFSKVGSAKRLLVVYSPTDDSIHAETFEGKMGINFNLEIVDASLRSKALEKWQTWKEQNNP